MRKEQLRWACRRGMLELDVLLGGFFEKHFDKLTGPQKHTFEELLKEQDPDLYNWFIGVSAPEDADFKALISLIKNAKQNEYRS